jgi:RNA polymerase sigma factor (sigma-70 family)
VATLEPGPVKGLFSWLVVYFRRHLPSQLVDEAKDFAAESLAITLAAIQKDNPKVEDPFQYAAGVARHKRADALRQVRRRKLVPLHELVDAEIAALVQIATAEDDLVRRELHKSLLQALKSLPPIELRFLRLRFFEELDNETASRRLGIAPAEGSRLKYIAEARLRFLMGVGEPRRRMVPARAVRQA